MRTSFKLLFVLIAVLPGVRAEAKPKAAGETREAPETRSTKDRTEVVYRSLVHYDFDDDVVDGELVRPEGLLVSGQSAASFRSLVELRKNFVPEMLKSADDL